MRMNKLDNLKDTNGVPFEVGQKISFNGYSIARARDGFSYIGRENDVFILKGNKEEGYFFEEIEGKDEKTQDAVYRMFFGGMCKIITE